MTIVIKELKDVDGADVLGTSNKREEKFREFFDRVIKNIIIPAGSDSYLHVALHAWQGCEFSKQDEIDQLRAELEKVKNGVEVADISLRQTMLTKHQEAMTAAHAYFCSCELGPERIRVAEIYENMRVATRVY